MDARRSISAVAVVITWALVATSVQLLPAASADDKPASGASARTPLTRPDSTSAMITARVSGVRVEDLSQRTERVQVFANPDGSWTSEEADGPVRVEDERGEWHDIDTTLIERNGVLEPKYAAADVQLSDGGDRVFAAITEEAKELEWRWNSTLPKPVIDGNTATYRDAVEGGDLVVTALATGFSHSVVLRERPKGLAVPPVDGAAPSSTLDAVQFSMPVTTDGTKLQETAAGGLQMKSCGRRCGGRGTQAVDVGCEGGRVRGAVGCAPR